MKGDDHIKQATVSVNYAEEKLNALKMFMTKKGMDLDAEIIAMIDKLYNKHVSADVREFIAERYGSHERKQ